MKHLIINADDFGMAGAVNAGIIRGHREGIITSASLLAGGAAAEEAAALAKDNPGRASACTCALR
ncbi:MAG TPA: ChbG/HpnK family deacetylase [Nitrospirota bacterium]